jgi:hypothetical protein
MGLAENDDMIQALAADRPDQPFNKAILPRWNRCGGLVPNAHGTQSTGDDTAIDVIAVSDHVDRSPVRRKCLCDLTGNLFRRRSLCDVDPDEVSALYPNDDDAQRRSKPIVGTTKKSMAAISGA